MYHLGTHAVIFFAVGMCRNSMNGMLPPQPMEIAGAPKNAGDAFFMDC